MSMGLFPLLLVLANVLKGSSEGTSSLTFVIDDTLSMGKEIKQVKESVNGIMDVVLQTKASVIQNMVLVTVNDPVVKLRAATSNKEEFKKEVDKVETWNATPGQPLDWDEVILKGIVEALKHSLPGSFIYVFTDASTKELYKKKEIVLMCQSKQTQIVFVVTAPYSYIRNDKKYEVYYDIANECSGIVYVAPSKKITSLLQYLTADVEKNQTVLTSRTVAANTYSNIPFTIDNHGFAIIKATGENVGITITKSNPAGHIDAEKKIWEPNNKIIKLHNPSSGQYFARVNAKSNASVLISGETDIRFDYGFSEIEPTRLGNMTKELIAGTRTHLSVSVTDPGHALNISYLQLLKQDEKSVIYKLPLKRIAKDYYTTQSFIAPKETFKIRVYGKMISTGHKISRLGKIPVTPIIPPDKIKPEVNIIRGTSTELDYKGFGKLTCKVYAYPKPVVRWYQSDGSVPLNSKTVNDLEQYNYINTIEIRNVMKSVKYYCIASNSEGTVSKTVRFTVKTPFVMKTVPKGLITVEYGTKYTIKCDIRSYWPMQIHWFFADERTGSIKRIMDSEKFLISKNGTELKIKKMDLDLVGRITCNASLINDQSIYNITSTRLRISGLVKPMLGGERHHNLKAVFGKSIEMSCSVSKGYPIPNITWYFLDKQVGTGNVYKISNVKQSDAGAYKCVAKNIAGSDQHEMLLIVQVPPTIEHGALLPNKVISSIEGDEGLTIPCTANGTPRPVITWTRDGHLITNNDKYSVQSGVLKINHPQLNDSSDSYVCTATNDAGSVQVKFQVKVYKKPKITNNINNKIMAIVDTATEMNCSTSQGFPKPNITWYFMRRVVGTANVLRIPKLELKDAGTYTCVAENIAGRVQHDILLTVQVPPTVEHGALLPNKEIFSIEGDEDLTIPCSANGTPKPDITWTRDGHLITQNDKYSVQSGVLKINHPQINDSSDFYVCTATNEAGSVQVKFQVKVYKKPKITNNLNNKIMALVDTSTEIICSTSEGFPKPNITWYFMRRVVGTANVLRIPKLELKDAGTYTCVAENIAGRVQHDILLTVQEKPMVIADTESLTILMGKSIQLSCRVSKGYPEPTFTWYFNGKQVGTGKVYQITHVTERDRGTYTCAAENSVGKDQQDTTVIVQEKPKLETNKTVTAVLGKPLNIICSGTKGFPAPEITWYFMGRQVAVGGVYHITKVEYYHEGSYKCVARNIVGTDQQNTEVIVEYVPRILENNTVYEAVAGDMALRIPCNVAGVPKPIVSWTWNIKNNTGMNGSISVEADGTLAIKNVAHAHTGSYTCHASNYLGFDHLSFFVTVSLQPKVNGPIHDVYLLKGQDAIIECGSDFDPTSQSVRWFLNTDVDSMSDFDRSTPGSNLDISTERDNTENPDSDTTTRRSDLDITTKRSSVRRGRFNRHFDENTENPDSDTTTRRSDLDITTKRSSVRRGRFNRHFDEMNWQKVDITKATESHNGVYICRKSDKHGGRTEAYSVDVGHPPSFKSLDSDPVMEWFGNGRLTLDCSVNASPEPEVVWTYNGKTLKENSLQVDASLKWGYYSCNVSNIHGYVQKIFQVVSSECIIDTINLHQQNKNMPLILSPEQSWPEFKINQGLMIVDHKDEIVFSCPKGKIMANGFVKFPFSNKVNAQCNMQDIYTINDTNYKLSDLQCNDEIEPIIRTGKSCSAENSEVIHVGFDIDGGSTFLQTYEVCYSHSYNMPMFSSARIFSRIAASNYSWYKYPDLPDRKEKGSTNTCATDNDKCCYGRTQLINGKDFDHIASQKSAFIEQLNSVPGWRGCGLETSWNDIEDSIAEKATEHIMTKVVSGVYKLEYVNGTIIPRYLWKTVQYDEDDPIGIVFVNNPKPTKEDVLCENICHKIFQFSKFKESFVYCCTYNEFLEKFHRDRLF